MQTDSQHLFVGEISGKGGGANRLPAKLIEMLERARRARNNFDSSGRLHGRLHGRIPARGYFSTVREARGTASCLDTSLNQLRVSGRQVLRASSTRLHRPASLTKVR